MDSQLDNEAPEAYDPHLLRVIQTLANGFTVATHLVATSSQSSNFPSLPLSNYAAVVVVEPIVDFTYHWKNGLLKRESSSETLTAYMIMYREIDQDSYDEYSQYGQGAEEKNLLSRKVEKHEAYSVEELISILAKYSVNLKDLRIAGMAE